MFSVILRFVQFIVGYKFLSLFGAQFVLLRHFDNETSIRRAYKVADKWYSEVYMGARTCLLKDGKTLGQSYIAEWEPITKRMKEVYGQ